AGEIRVSPGANYALVIFFSGQDPDEYRATVEYTNYPDAFLDVGRFGRFRFAADIGVPDRSCVYLSDSGADLALLEGAGFSVEWYGWYFVAYYE
ncbi:MAG: hypothetical protein K2K53_00400, partial [Oscillospiraceae bacterium]|nr:hypothetical protein [Oscillospiraceae bacterium]